MKSRHSQARITKLDLADGGSTSDLEEMKKLCHDFYNILYSNPRDATSDQLSLGMAFQRS
jgi:hypothetical protein